MYKRGGRFPTGERTRGIDADDEEENKTAAAAAADGQFGFCGC